MKSSWSREGPWKGLRKFASEQDLSTSCGLISGLDFRGDRSELKCAHSLLFQEQREPAPEAPGESQQHELDSRILKLQAMKEVGRRGKSQGGQDSTCLLSQRQPHWGLISSAEAGEIHQPTERPAGCLLFPI